MSEYSAMPAEATKARVAELTGTMYQESLDLKGLERQLAQENAQAAAIEGRMNEITAQAKAMKPGVPCPTCGKPSTEEDIEKHKAEFRRQYIALRDEANKKKESAAAIQTKIDEINTNLAAETEEKSSLDAKMGTIVAFYSEKVSPAQTAVNSLKASVARSEGIVKAAGIDPDRFAAELERLNAEKAKYPAIREAWQKAYDEYNEVSGEFRTADAGKNACQAEVNRISAELEKAKRQAEGDSLAITEQKLASARDDLADADLRMHTASDDRIAYEYIGKNMCADDGIKKMIFSNFIPVFNESVDRNIKKLGLPFGLEFADDMSSTFRSSPGFAPSYDMLSQGQRRKLGFAVQMAIRDLVSLIGNFRINFLSMDEVLDISTDDEGMRDMMDIVRSMSDEIGCTLVITHRGSVVADKFDYRITVENDGNYSQLGELEKL
jgi:DNA repair exonuclease SbcCD ATPase subunit